MGLRHAARAGVGRRARVAAVLVLLAIATSACGSRLPEDVLADIDDDRSSSGQQASSSGDADDAATDGFAIGGLGDGGSDGATGDTGGTGTGGSAASTTGGTAGGASSGPCRGGATDKGVTANEIKVGSIVTASGPLPGATEGSYRGAQAYLAKVNAAGGVCGRRITLVKGDDGLDPQRARGEFLRLEPQILSMVGGFSVADSGFGDLVESTGIPYVGTMWTRPGAPPPCTRRRRPAWSTRVRTSGTRTSTRRCSASPSCGPTSAGCGPTRPPGARP